MFSYTFSKGYLLIYHRDCIKERVITILRNNHIHQFSLKGSVISNMCSKVYKNKSVAMCHAIRFWDYT